MSEENIISNEDQLENGESQTEDIQELDEATYEPRSAVEGKGDFEQSEAIQKSLEDLPMPCCPPGDLPEGSGTLGGENDAVELANRPEAGQKEFTGPEIRDLSQEEVDLMMVGSPPDWDHGPPKDEIDLEDENTVLGQQPKVRQDLGDLKPASSDDKYKTVDPDQLEYEPGPVQQPPDWDHGPPKDKIDLEDENTVLGRQPKIREDLSDLQPAGSDDDDKDEASSNNLPNPQAAAEIAGATPQPGQTPEPGPHPFPNVAIEDDGSGGRHKNVDLENNLHPAPDYEAMSPTEQSVVEIIGKAISNEEYRTTLLSDARAAIEGYSVTDEDQIALGEMTEESFDFFATEVKARFEKAMLGNPKDAQQHVLAQVVHAVWRDLNPGGLAYILAHKIPNKYLI